MEAEKLNLPEQTENPHKNMGETFFEEMGLDEQIVTISKPDEPDAVMLVPSQTKTVADKIREERKGKPLRKIDLINIYISECERKGIEPEVSEIKLRNMSKANIEVAVGVRSSAAKKVASPSLLKQTPIETLDEATVEVLAEGLYVANGVASNAYELAFKYYEHDIGGSIPGYADDWARPAMYKKSMPLFRGIVKRYPSFARTVGDVVAQLAMMHGLKTREHFESVEKKKKRSANNNRSGPVVAKTPARSGALGRARPDNIRKDIKYVQMPDGSSRIDPDYIPNTGEK